MTLNRSLPSQARWTLTALFALSLLPACLGAQSMGIASDGGGLRSDEDIAKLPADTEYAYVTGTGVSSTGAATLAKFSKLKSLYCGWQGTRGSPKFLQTVLKNKNLCTVSVYGGSALRDADFKNLAGLAALADFTVCDIAGITIETVRAATRGGKLSALSIYDCPKVEGGDAMKLIGELKLSKICLGGSQYDLSQLVIADKAQLAYAFFRRVKGLNDETFEKLISCVNLQTLSLCDEGDTVAVSEKALHGLKGLTKLETLVLTGAFNCTDDVVQLLATLPALQRVSLLGGSSPSPKLTSAGALALLTHAKLMSVSFAGQKDLVIDPAANFPGGPLLSDLDVSSTAITDAALQAICPKCPRLNALVVIDCPKLTQKGIAAIKKSNANLYVQTKAYTGPR